MPYDQANGRLYADDTRGVGLASVALCLKEPFTDTAKLCCSEKINPYSLIGPRFYRDTKGSMPGRAPGKYGTPPVLGDTTDSLPDQNAVPSAKAGEVTGEFACSSLTTATAEYTFRSAATFMYEKRRFGFFVPYVQDPQDIFALRDLYWKRYGPKDGNWVTTNGKRKLTDSWCVLDHFDGYLHNAKPADVISGVILAYGQIPQFVPVLATGTWKITDVLGPEGRNNPGGNVSVPAVFGGEKMIYGATLFKKTGSKYAYVRSAIGGALDDTAVGGGGMLEPVTFGSAALNDNAQYLIVPWVTSDNVEINAGGLINIPAGGAKFYCCNYDVDHKAYGENEEPIAPKYFDVSNVRVEHERGSTEYFISLSLTNRIANYQLIAEFFDNAVQYNTKSSALFRNGGCNFVTGSNNLSIGMDLTSTPPSYALSREYKFKFTYEDDFFDSVSNVRVTFNCVDKNYPNTVKKKQQATKNISSGDVDLTDPIDTTDPYA